jgi:ATP-dependent Lon protease
MAKFTFAVFPVRFYPFPLSVKEGLGVSRTVSINALQQSHDIVAVPQRRFEATDVKEEEDLLKVGVLVSEWKKTQEEKGAWRIEISFSSAVKIDRIWFDENSGCFMGEGEIVHLYPSLEEEADFALAEACKYIFHYFNTSDFFQLIPTLRAVIQKTYNWLRNTHPSTLSQDGDSPVQNLQNHSEYPRNWRGQLLYPAFGLRGNLAQQQLQRICHEYLQLRQTTGATNTGQEKDRRES